MTLRITIVVLMTLCEAAGSSAIAQTLIEPNSKSKVSQPSGSTKPQPVLRSKFCSRFGAGFAQIPGTDTCVKIGGFVTIEGAVNHGR
jgi:Porin subfamily